MHYGVVGMKWGKTRTKASTVQIIAARQRVVKQKGQVKQAEAKAAFTKDPKERAKAEKVASKKKVDYLKNPDRVVAARLTRGEKAVVAILGSVTGGPGLTVIAATSARSRRIEQKQDKGKYDKK